MLGEDCTFVRDEALDTAELQPLFHSSHSDRKTAELDQSCQAKDSLPKEVQLFRLENMAVPCCYLLVGITQGLSGILLNVYPLDLNATEAEQVTLSTIVVFPSTIKVLYGFLSDSLPILGARRKPYMLLGYCLVSFSMFGLLVSTDLSLEFDGNSAVAPDNAPSVELLSALFFMLGVGLWFADVMGDSLVAEKARLEPPVFKGTLQASCYACRFFGTMVAAPLSTYLYSAAGPKSIVAAMAVAPVIISPLIYFLRDDTPVKLRSIRDRCNDIWTTVKTRSVWQPMAFVYIYNLLQVSNGAWRQFLKTNLDFTEAQLNCLLVAAYILLFLGTVMYKHCFLGVGWRCVYQICIICTGFLSLMQLLLISGNTFRIKPFFFALGDDAFAEFIKGIQFLPFTIMMVNLCPEGSEGASYSLFTTFSNSAMLLAPAISTNLLGIWDVSKRALENDELSGLTKLTLLTTALKVSPILFLSWLPQSGEDLAALSSKPYSGSSIGGIIFLLVVFCSIMYIFTVSLLNIFCPGWAGETR